MTAKVIPMPKKPASTEALPATWKPASGWAANSDHGFAGGLDAAGQPVDLVRLSDLIRWQEDAKRIPRSEAIQAVIDALPSDVMAWLYKIMPGKRAALMDANATFGQPTAESIAASKAQRMQDALQREWEASNNRFASSEWMQRNRLGGTLQVSDGKIGLAPAKVEPVEPGRAALLQYLGTWLSARMTGTERGVKIDAIDAKHATISSLAIPHAKAYALFDWGTVDVVDVVTPIAATELPKTWAELVRYRKATSGHAWSQDMRKILVAEEKRRNDAGQSGVRKAMASELGEMTVSALGEHIRKADTGTKSGRGRSKAA